ncbi:MAG: cupin domain-containing protein [Pseudomonadota bacterium]
MSSNKKAMCRLIRPQDRSDNTYRGKQGFDYFEGIARQTVNSEAICMHLLEIPPGGRANAHKHDTHETAIYVLEGKAQMWWGDKLEHVMEINAGDLVYIPADVPHLPVNISESWAKAIVARTDPNEQESVTLLPELEQYVPAI